jgi:hypothetical protein
MKFLTSLKIRAAARKFATLPSGGPSVRTKIARERALEANARGEDGLAVLWNLLG